jgi:hypothetical protein
MGGACGGAWATLARTDPTNVSPEPVEDLLAFSMDNFKEGTASTSAARIFWLAPGTACETANATSE